jgi:hypothetical protein
MYWKHISNISKKNNNAFLDTLTEKEKNIRNFLLYKNNELQYDWAIRQLVSINNYDFAQYIIEHISPSYFQYLCPNFRSNAELAKKAILIDISMYDNIDETLQQNKEFNLEIIKRFPELINSKNCFFRHDLLIKDFVLDVIKDNILILEYLPRLRKDSEFMNSAIKITAVAARYIPAVVPGIFYDIDGNYQGESEEFVINVVQGNPNAIREAAEGLQNSENFILKALFVNVNIFKYLNDEMRSNPNIIKRAVGLKPEMVKYALLKKEIILDIFASIAAKNSKTQNINRQYSSSSLWRRENDPSRNRAVRTDDKESLIILDKRWKNSEIAIIYNRLPKKYRIDEDIIAAALRYDLDIFFNVDKQLIYDKDIIGIVLDSFASNYDAGNNKKYLAQWSLTAFMRYVYPLLNNKLFVLAMIDKCVQDYNYSARKLHYSLRHYIIKNPKNCLSEDKEILAAIKNIRN